MGYLEWLGRLTLTIILCVTVMIIMIIIYENGYAGEFLDYGTYKFATGLICGVILKTVLSINRD